MISLTTRALAAGVMVLLTCTAPVLAGEDTDEDQEAIAELKQAGMDLARPQTIDFAFYFPELSGAQRVVPKLRAQGFTTRIKPAGSGQDYLLYARKRLVVTLPAMVQWRKQFEALAKAENGEYDGWGWPSTQ